MIMGGFHLFRLPADAPSIPWSLKSFEPSTFVIPIGRQSRKDEVPVCPLKFEDVPADLLEIIAPTETELKDRGKSDALTKIIVLVQTLWFVIQCIARGTRNLPLTELEVVTLAYAMLNFFIYVFWWNKPKNVECPTRVYKASTASHEESAETLDEWNDYWTARWGNKQTRGVIGKQDENTTVSKPRLPPKFWAGRIANRNIGPPGLGPSVLGAAFGAIHCISWSSEFPTRAELVLWRVSCAVMIAVPFLVAVTCASWVATDRMEKKYTGWLIYIVYTCVALLLLLVWLYVAGRIATLVIAFTSLRSLPPSAFITVDWTTFIPHISSYLSF
ncbi:hypothetical protein M408DRAFT_30906 [Serendipita vermifera MAFF 305830]|uniref:Uncharacterized protein n=1 Tax=Serendipita vermifera MAFF 305830 TaxID=933852 RepID=A0A0C2VZT9_SERVB|nr:hypothetical protein M408DRAFT_30906 [Serendipita vermifera MAFF 305830]